MDRVEKIANAYLQEIEKYRQKSMKRAESLGHSAGSGAHFAWLIIFACSLIVPLMLSEDYGWPDWTFPVIFLAIFVGGAYVWKTFIFDWFVRYAERSQAKWVVKKERKLAKFLLKKIPESLTDAELQKLKQTIEAEMRKYPQ